MGVAHFDEHRLVVADFDLGVPANDSGSRFGFLYLLGGHGQLILQDVALALERVGCALEIHNLPEKRLLLVEPHPSSAVFHDGS